MKWFRFLVLGLAFLAGFALVDFAVVDAAEGKSYISAEEIVKRPERFYFVTVANGMKMYLDGDSFVKETEDKDYLYIKAKMVMIANNSDKIAVLDQSFRYDLKKIATAVKINYVETYNAQGQFMAEESFKDEFHQNPNISSSNNAANMVYWKVNGAPYDKKWGEYTKQYEPRLIANIANV